MGSLEEYLGYPCKRSVKQDVGNMKMCIYDAFQIISVYLQERDLIAILLR